MARSPKKKRSRPKGPRPNKSEFVRSMPVDMSAIEVVEAGKKKGIKLSRTLVYVVRNQQAKRGDRVTPRRKRTDANVTVRGANAEIAFRRLAFEVTVPRAREILGELERGLRMLIAG